MTMPPEEYKMWLAVRSDLGMPAGKLAVQSGHAFQLLTMEVLKNHPELMRLYTEEQTIVKVVVKADDEKHLLKVSEVCKENGIPYSLIKDAGRTVFDGPTYTVCAFGPSLRKQLPSKLKHLQLYDL